MIIRSKAPLRIGLAGGGTDVSPYSELYGGAILNATVNLYAYASLEPLSNGQIEFVNDTNGSTLILESSAKLDADQCRDFELFAGVYNRVVKQFGLKPLSFRLTSYIDAPQGSGLGTSSTIVVSLLGAFAGWLGLPLGKYDLAHLAYEVERVDLAMSGGKQDQYAATFGGINFLEFFSDDRVIVNPLQLKPELVYELEYCTLLYFTDTRRHSAGIINEQVRNVKERNAKSVEAMHRLKDQAQQMKECLLRGDLDDIGSILNFGWQNKKDMASSITNQFIDAVYEKALENGATGGKISGAGGGGFMFFYCPGVTRNRVARAIETLGGKVQPFKFTQQGLVTWKS